MKVSDIPQAKISQSSQRFLCCMLKLREVYGDVSNSLIEFYGEYQAEKEIENRFSIPYRALEDVIDAFLIDSIKLNTLDINKMEI